VNGEAEKPVLSKCANPACSANFRYLGEGKLYLVDSKAALVRRKAPAELKYAGKSCTYEYLWLCSVCCRHMMIQIGGDLEVKVARKRSTQPDFEADIPASRTRRNVQPGAVTDADAA
jgi:hypothetical protein